MKILSNSFIFLSKLKINCNIASYAKFSHYANQRYLLFKTSSSVNLSAHRNSSNTNLYQSNHSVENGKFYIEKENLFAHKIMENLPQYENTLIKQPSSSSDIPFSESAKTSDIVDEFVKVTLQYLPEGLPLENSKFTVLINKLCRDLSELSDGNIERVLHYLCMWPPASGTQAQNFKILWNMLDRECVKRMHNWDVSFQKHFLKMTHSNSHLVFVYGTLKKGEPNHDLIDEKTEGVVKFIGNAKTVKKWPLVIASRYNIPYLLYSEGKGMYVFGEVYEVDDVMLAKFDEFECHPQYYTRLVEEVQLIPETEGRFLKPWIYFLKNFRPVLLDLPFLSDYSSEGPHGLKYVTRYNRPTGKSYYSDVMDL